VSCAKTALPIEMPFGMLSWVNPRNHVVDGGTDHQGRDNFEGEEHAAMPRHARRHSDVNCAKTAEPIAMPFGLLRGLGWAQGSITRSWSREGAIIMVKDMPG